MRIAAIIVAVILSASLRADDADRDKLLQRMAKIQGEALLEFRTVKDKTTAESARKKLVKLGREMDQANRAVKALNLPDADLAAFRKKVEYDLEPVNKMIEKEILRVSYIPRAIAVLDDQASCERNRETLGSGNEESGGDAGQGT